MRDRTHLLLRGMARTRGTPARRAAPCTSTRVDVDSSTPCDKAHTHSEPPESAPPPAAVVRTLPRASRLRLVRRTEHAIRVVCVTQRGARHPRRLVRGGHVAVQSKRISIIRLCRPETAFLVRGMPVCTVARTILACPGSSNGLLSTTGQLPWATTRWLHEHSGASRGRERRLSGRAE